MRQVRTGCKRVERTAQVVVHMKADPGEWRQKGLSSIKLTWNSAGQAANLLRSHGRRQKAKEGLDDTGIGEVDPRGNQRWIEFRSAKQVLHGVLDAGTLQRLPLKVSAQEQLVGMATVGIVFLLGCWSRGSRER